MDRLISHPSIMQVVIMSGNSTLSVSHFETSRHTIVQNPSDENSQLLTIPPIDLKSRWIHEWCTQVALWIMVLSQTMSFFLSDDTDISLSAALSNISHLYWKYTQISLNVNTTWRISTLTSTWLSSKLWYNMCSDACWSQAALHSPQHYNH